ncbi:DNA-processing protein DprA [Albirhodobacter sp. R86504]|uniref:DNA-processing protein DprA n=1 Tax=Albirhodobacter sp. R86504 TaxID=3093848 RepID=UPI00366D9961
MDGRNLFSHPTPFTPTPKEEDDISVLRLIRSRRVGPSTFHKLIAQYGSVAAALEMLPHVAAAAGAQDYALCSIDAARAELDAGRALGATFVQWGSPNYPTLLREIPDPPPALWMIGDIKLLTRLCVAVVGARAASGLGIRMTRKIAQELGEAGCVIVSGLAKGVDCAAHEAALETGTIAVQPCGLDVLYPRETEKLARDIAEKGLRLSEHPIGMAPRAQSFLARNRIISGLSRALVVTEASSRSGALNAARHASDQGREVMAVPGHPFEPRAAGCNILIRDGAALIRGGRDVLEGLAAAGVSLPHDPEPRALILPQTPRQGRARHETVTEAATPDRVAHFAHCDAELPPPQTQTAPPELDELALVEWILGALQAGPVQEDELFLRCPAPTNLCLQAISVLELEGEIVREAGGQLRAL